MSIWSWHNLILNGDFSQSPTDWAGQSWEITNGKTLPGWYGTEIEWGHQNNYISGGAANWVVELDGNGASAITVLNQNFYVKGPVDAVLNFDTALRTDANSHAGLEGYRVDILDASGGIVKTQSFFPTQNTISLDGYTVHLPQSGTYTLRFTELGPNDSLGAIIDNVKLLVCFVAGTLIDTPEGPRPVESLRPGDLVSTVDAGAKPVLWRGTRRISRREQLADPRLRPIHIAPGALGPGLPVRGLAVSPQHRILLSGWRSELYFGEPEVLVPAHRLVNDSTIRRVVPVEDVTYVHFLCDDHQIVLAEGLATESFHPNPHSLAGVDPAARQELLTLFPELDQEAFSPWEMARPVVRGPEARLAA